jgi:hypothetical protein
MRTLPYAAWLIFTAVSLVLGFLLTQPTAALVLWSFALYGLQGFIAELLGVRMNRTSITLPRRLSSSFPLVLWREQIRYSEIYKIASKPKTQVQVHKSTGERVRVTFADRASKALFIESIKQTNPSINIYR